MDHQKIAATCNNEAWDLIERSNLDTHEKSRLLTLAATALFHCEKVSTSHQIAHARLLFGWAAARCQCGDVAVQNTSQALDHFEREESEDWERAFVYVANAAAHHAQCEDTKYQSAFLRAQELGAGLIADDAEYFRIAFQTVPRSIYLVD